MASSDDEPHNLRVTLSEQRTRRSRAPDRQPIPNSQFRGAVQRSQALWRSRGQIKEMTKKKPIPDKLAEIEALRADVVDWRSPWERRGFLSRFDRLVENWRGEIPDLREIFRPEEIELLLQESLNLVDNYYKKAGNRFIDFVRLADYRCEPELDEATGEPILRRTTALHLAARLASDYGHPMSDECREILDDLFDIYYGTNYVDEEDGYSHFHMYCRLAIFYRHRVEQFLKLGWADVNELVERTGDTPLHLVEGKDEESVKLLLRLGGDPNRANKRGRTPVHAMRANRRALQAMFRIAGASGRPLLIDARDELGLTPLGLAVERLDLDKVELLLDYGADAALVELPPVWQCPVKDNSLRYRHKAFEFELAARALAVVECLENKGGYALDRRGASRVMMTFARMGAYYLSEREAQDRSWYEEDERFVEQAKKLMILPRVHPEFITKDREEIAIGNFLFLAEIEGRRRGGRRSKPSRKKESSKVPRLSVHDLIPMRPEEAAKIVTYRDYYELARSFESQIFGHPRYKDDCRGYTCEKLAKIALHLSEKLARGFFRRWALQPFSELTRNELPILCCKKIIGLLMNRDLHNICLAVEGQDSG